jgi:hypothetical protein
VGFTAKIAKNAESIDGINGINGLFFRRPETLHRWVL